MSLGRPGLDLKGCNFVSSLVAVSGRLLAAVAGSALATDSKPYQELGRWMFYSQRDFTRSAAHGMREKWRGSCVLFLAVLDKPCPKGITVYPDVGLSANPLPLVDCSQLE